MARRLIPERPSHAAVTGAMALGVPAWVIGSILLSRHYDRLPPDGFKGLRTTGTSSS